MARFYRHFRVVDCSRHCGLPVATACFLLALITGAMQIFSLYFILDPWNYIMMGYGGGTLACGLLAVLTGFRIFTILYLLAQSLINIPIGVVIGYVSWVLANDDGECYIGYWNTYCYYYTDYERWLATLGDGLLWTGVIIACISVIFSCITLAGYRKLRLYQTGVNTAVRHGRGLDPAGECVAETVHHHHVVQPVVVAPQPTVITVPTAPPPVVVQTTPSVYPQLHQTGYVVQQTQPTVYIT